MGWSAGHLRRLRRSDGPVSPARLRDMCEDCEGDGEKCAAERRDAMVGTRSAQVTQLLDGVEENS